MNCGMRPVAPWSLLVIAMVTVAVLLGMTGTPAQAAQKRVTVSPTSNQNRFLPTGASVHIGDHVTWVWASGTHTVTSGSSGTPNGIFDSGLLEGGAGFTWKVDRTGNIPYYCTPHWSVPMTGSVLSYAPEVVLTNANFRITEIATDVAGGADLIEIANLGTASGNLGRYRIAVPGDVEGLPPVDVVVPVDGRIVIHANASGVNTATDIYVPLLAPLPDAAGSVALYAPNTINTSLADATQIIDYVAYGAAGGANEATAVTAGVWPAGEFVPGVTASNRSLEFCGEAADRGAAHWEEVDPPNFGGEGTCSQVSAPGPGAVSIALGPATPHPVTSSARVTFSLPRAAHVRLDLFDLQGRHLSRVVDEARAAGTHTATIDADRGLPTAPGVYALRLQSGSESRVRRMVVVH